MATTSEKDQVGADTSVESLPPGGAKLTDAQRAKVERNRQAALLRRQKRQQAKPQPATTSPPKKSKQAEPIDTGGGFLVDPEEEEAKVRKVIHPPGALLLLAGDELVCAECGREFLESYLHETFQVDVCDECRDTEEKHKLITRSTAKEKYLLKDIDLDKREPPLRFVEKKNPRNEHWGRMKLYLESQVAARSLEVWGGEEQLEEERERRQEAKVKVKQKRYDKKVKDLRMAVRSSLWKKDLSGHQHEYAAESYDEEEDMYSKTCTSCGHVLSYEKM